MTSVACMHRKKLELTATLPGIWAAKNRTEELMWLFVSRQLHGAGSLAGAKWEWNEQNPHGKARRQRKRNPLEHIPFWKRYCGSMVRRPRCISPWRLATRWRKARCLPPQSPCGNWRFKLPAVSAAGAEEGGQVRRPPAKAFYGKLLSIAMPVPMKEAESGHGNSSSWRARVLRRGPTRAENARLYL